jgi:hypothetical protein
LRKSQQGKNRSFDGLLVFGLILIALWFVPEVIRFPLVFPFQTIADRNGIDLLSALTPPIAGALLLLLFALRLQKKRQFALSFAVSVTALFILLLGNHQVVLALFNADLFAGYLQPIKTAVALFATTAQAAVSLVRLLGR